MRSYPADYELIDPGNLQEVLRLLHEEPGRWTPIAGGTEIMVLYGAGKLGARNFVSIWKLPEFSGIAEDEQALSIGGGCTFTQIRKHAGIQKDFPLLAQCASWTGSIANQNRGTLAGNLANASPAADSPPALFAYEAEIEMVSVRGVRRIPYTEFHLGYKQTALAQDELIRAIRLPKRFGDCFRYARKVGARNAQAISKICMAATGRMEKGRIAEIRIGVGSVAPTPMRAVGTESVLRGELLDDALLAEARRRLLREAAPIDDIRSTAEYRKLVAANLLEEMLRAFAASEKQG